MPTVSLILMTIAALIHVGFFVMESLLWRSPSVYRVFGVQSQEEAETMSFALLNQGYYNLFLATGTFVGVAGSWTLWVDRHELLVFCALFMIGAAVVLVASNHKLWRGALVQGGLPALAMLAALVL